MNYDEAEEDYGYTKEELLKETEGEVPFNVEDWFLCSTAPYEL